MIIEHEMLTHQNPTSLILDVLLYPLILSLIIIYLLVAPYTKVEESFNLQATHDILRHGLPTNNIYSSLRQNYDHFSFPGAVPRTFVGALILAIVSKPFIHLTGDRFGLLIVRTVMGVFTSFAVISYKKALARAYGKDTGRWFILLLAGQFHVIFYASRTLPNVFAFNLTTIALGKLLPVSELQEQSDVPKRQKQAIFLLVLAAVIFRSEVAVLLTAEIIYMLLHPRMSLETIISTCLRSAYVSFFLTFTIDSYFWQFPVWPELSGFYFNVIQGKSSDWGTSPFYYYYFYILPKLLLNPLIYLIMIPLGLKITSMRYHLKELIVPSLLFVFIYSFQPHKEARFIIYVVVPLTGAASYSAAKIWNESSRKLFFCLGSLILVASILCSAMLSTGMLLISSLNYPGGQAISNLHTLIIQTKFSEEQQRPHQLSIHLDVLSCMTGVSRFLQIPVINGIPLKYDKTEDETLIRKPEWWRQFDYALMENPEHALGRWDLIATIYGYSGIEILRPEDASSFIENLEKVFLDNHVLIEENGIGGLLKPTLRKMRESILRIFTRGLFLMRLVTGGWWIGPRLEPKIRILKKASSP